MRVICTYGLQVGPECEKDQFYNRMPCEWDLRNLDKVFFCLDDFNKHAELFVIFREIRVLLPQSL